MERDIFEDRRKNYEGEAELEYKFELPARIEFVATNSDQPFVPSSLRLVREISWSTMRETGPPFVHPFLCLFPSEKISRTQLFFPPLLPRTRSTFLFSRRFPEGKPKGVLFHLFLRDFRSFSPLSNRGSIRSYGSVEHLES